jgi:nitrite reductase/ring-hydroxylating ferredoxin subunit
MSLSRDPGGRAVPTAGVLPPVRHGVVHEARGSRLIDVAALGDRGVAEVRTDEHGVLAVGLSGGEPFAVSNVCRHQAAKLGRGRVDETGCLECPWHRARFDVRDGRMVDGPKGRIFGFKPYSKAVAVWGERIAPLHTHPVEVRDGAIWLVRTRDAA